MNRILLYSLMAVGVLALLAFPYFVPDISACPCTTTTTTITNTVTGFVVPNAAGLTNGIFVFLFPIVGAGLFVGLTIALRLDGEINSFIIKLGLMVGSLLGMMSLSSTNPTIIPFAVPVVTAIYLVTYMWKRV